MIRNGGVKNRLQVIVIGGGAAGFFGAIACAEFHPHTQVLLLEAGQQPLTKVRISGGGRCNVTHSCFDPAVLVQHYPRGGRALRGPFSQFQPRHTIEWFSRRGVVLKTEADGRMFPITDDSATIVECLMASARQAGVTLWTGSPVATVTTMPGERFAVMLKSGERLECDRLLLATGSSPQGYALARSLGHTIEAPVPSLFTFTIADRALRELAGVAVEHVTARVKGIAGKPLEQQGPILITHWGMSGPAVLKLSAWGARLLHDQGYRATLEVNWLPQFKEDTIRQILTQTRADWGRRTIASTSPLPVPRRLWQYLTHRCGIGESDRWAELAKAQLHQLITELTRGQYAIAGKGAFKEEFVTCGGVRLQEVDCKTMASRICPGLHFAGEILDIDGVTGGFNFQSAWTTGWLAGQAIGTPPIPSSAPHP